MAFAISGLARTSSSGNTTAGATWRYSSLDTIATQAASGYFNNATRELKRNDSIELVDLTNNVVEKTYVTSASGAATVTVDPPLAFTQEASVADAAAATAVNPTAPVAVTEPTKAQGTTVTSNAATDLDDAFTALGDLRDEVATYEIAISALIIDVADIRTQLNLAITRLEAAGIIATV